MTHTAYGEDVLPAGTRVMWTADSPKFSQDRNQEGTVQSSQVNPPGLLATCNPATRVYYVALDSHRYVTASRHNLRETSATRG